jgi:sec-independent protein translocase protein TatA
MKIGTTELLVILAIVLIIFGPSQIPKLTRMFKKSKKNFDAALNEDEQ